MPKIFCIGANKTGTTSLLEFFRSNGFTCGDQAKGERLFVRCGEPDYSKALVKFAETADFFQDLPFSATGTWEVLNRAFPDALFVMTKRTSADEWYRSLTEFHAEKFGDGRRAPTARQLQKATYRYPGFMWDANRALYGSPANNPYRKDDLIAWYEKHLSDARLYFNVKNNYLEIEIGDPDAGKKIADFVGFAPRVPILPHLNRSTE
ncbi:MAG: hypothetical protein LC670_13240 [Flavobacteriales bacterium]|nr:hypothetical protein [Flavobacteriales bacterium]